MPVESDQQAQRGAQFKVFLLLPIIVSLCLYTPAAGSYINLFQQFPPALRVFRAMAEFILMLICSTASLFIWEKSKEKDLRNAIGPLLFSLPSEMENDSETEELYDSEGLNTEDELAGFDMKPSPKVEPLSSLKLFHASLDLLLLHLSCLLLFAVSSSADSEMNKMKLEMKVSSVAPAMVIPLVCFLCFVAYSFIPWKNNRKNFWTVVWYTPAAPFHPVTFRDGFIGDIFTSAVRPLQDLAFTLFYLVSGLEGWWTASYDLNNAERPLERSWLLHKVVLPACMVSPLCWRFLQCLRQVFDERRRWPYLGNALKYLIAAEIALFGAFSPSTKQNIVWLTSFVCATLYQLWWDTVMDWELFEIKETENKRNEGIGSSDHHSKSIEMTSLSSEASSTTSMTNYPIFDQSTSSFLSNVKQLRLRSKRLYSNKCIYYCIFFVNILLRFCWTLSFIPPRYLTPNGQVKDTFGSDIQHILNPIIASAEILRRFLWGLIRVELEAIKTNSTTSIHLEHESLTSPTKSDQMEIMDIECKDRPSQNYSAWNDLSQKHELHVLRELCLWATVFASLGLLAATH